MNRLISPKNHTTPHKKNEGHRYPSSIREETKVELLLKQYSQHPTRKRQNHVRRERKCNNNRPSDTQFSLQRFAKQ